MHDAGGSSTSSGEDDVSTAPPAHRRRTGSTVVMETDLTPALDMDAAAGSCTSSDEHDASAEPPARRLHAGSAVAMETDLAEMDGAALASRQASGYAAVHASVVAPSAASTGGRSPGGTEGLGFATHRPHAPGPVTAPSASPARPPTPTAQPAATGTHQPDHDFDPVPDTYIGHLTGDFNLPRPMAVAVLEEARRSEPQLWLQWVDDGLAIPGALRPAVERAIRGVSDELDDCGEYLHSITSTAADRAAASTPGSFLGQLAADLLERATMADSDPAASDNADFIVSEWAANPVRARDWHRHNLRHLQLTPAAEASLREALADWRAGWAAAHHTTYADVVTRVPSPPLPAPTVPDQPWHQQRPRRSGRLATPSSLLAPRRSLRASRPPRAFHLETDTDPASIAAWASVNVATRAPLPDRRQSGRGATKRRGGAQ